MTSLKQDIAEAIRVIRSGGSILYPTDTVWGLGCDATNPKAIEKIFRIKQRPENQSFILLVDSADLLEYYVGEVPDVIYQLIEASEDPLTIVYPKARNLPDKVCAADGSIAIRVVDHPFCSPLIQRLDRPIVSTSANFSGSPTPKRFSDISKELIKSVDYVVESFRDDINSIKSSSIIRFTESGNFEIIRK